MNKLQARTENANVGQSNVSSSELGDVNVIIGANGSGKSGLMNYPPPKEVGVSWVIP